MRFSTVIAAVTMGVAVSAIPLAERQAVLCPGTDSNAVCCATDVLGVADLDCAPPPTVPTDVDDFIAICSNIGQQAECCLLPVLGQALVCSAPVG